MSVNSSMTKMAINCKSETNGGDEQPLQWNRPSMNGRSIGAGHAATPGDSEPVSPHLLKKEKTVQFTLNSSHHTSSRNFAIDSCVSLATENAAQEIMLLAMSENTSLDDKALL
jgi:hypothetical protein